VVTSGAAATFSGGTGTSATQARAAGSNMRMNVAKDGKMRVSRSLKIG
jgi:hypothetical protein